MNFKRLLTVLIICFLSMYMISCGTSENSDNSNYENGEGVIKHYTAKDWDKNDMYKKIGEDVWKFSNQHQDAKKLKLIIVEECIDSKGNKSNYESIILFNSSDIKEYSTYKDDASFNKNCYEFGVKLLDWHSCGNSIL